MITQANRARQESPSDAWHPAFLEMIPAIRQQAELAFRNKFPDAREDAVADVVCAACAAYARLAERGETHRATPRSLARYAIRRYRCGRHFGCRMNISDILSPHCQLRKGIVLERLEKRDRKSGAWREVVVEDHRAGPADTAVARLDISEWFKGLRQRHRQIAEALALGAQTREVARQFGLSEGRVSQLRNEFCNSWLEFQGN